jgi:hypothetical protein
MPGFKMPDRTATLVFEDGDLQGLELTVRLNVPLDFYLDLVELADSAAKEDGLSGARSLMRRFAEVALKEWNLVSLENQPVPLTPESFTAHIDPINGGAMLRRYLEAVGGTPGPLRNGSNGGATLAKRRVKNRRPS